MWEESEYDNADQSSETDDGETPDSTSLLKDLQEKFTDTTSPIGYSDAKTIYEYYKHRLSMSEISNFLSTKDAYTLTRRTKRPRHFNMTYCRKLRENLQLDTFFMLEFRKENDGIGHILIGVDVWSRFMWAVPIQNTTGSEGLRATKNILTRAGGYVDNITVDKGSEFISAKYKKYVQSKRIKLHYTNSKAAICERAILTLKRYIYRYFAETDDLRYIDKLDMFIQTYNDHFHRFLQMSPREAELSKNQEKVREKHTKKRLYLESKRKKGKFEIGDKVRLSRIKSRMSRGYDNTFNYEVFEIYAIDRQMPIPRYYVKQPETGEKITGSFYSNELVLTRQHKYKLTVLQERTRRGKKEYLVKWKGYPGECTYSMIYLVFNVFLFRHIQ